MRCQHYCGIGPRGPKGLEGVTGPDTTVQTVSSDGPISLESGQNTNLSTILPGSGNAMILVNADISVNPPPDDDAPDTIDIGNGGVNTTSIITQQIPSINATVLSGTQELWNKNYILQQTSYHLGFSFTSQIINPNISVILTPTLGITVKNFNTLVISTS